MTIASDTTEWKYERFITEWTVGDTFAYWLCLLKRNAKLPSTEKLASAMSSQCDIEEQMHDPAGFSLIHPYSPDPLMPVAPVSVTRRWAPFPAAEESLGKCKKLEMEEHTHSTFAYAVWTPAWITRAPRKTDHADALHFHFLLTLASVAAAAREMDVFLAGKIGWSYETEQAGMNPEVALAMLKFGYLFPDRISR